MRRRHLLRHTRRHPSAILLLAQLAGMLLFPFVEQTAGAGLVVGVMYLAAAVARLIAFTIVAQQKRQLGAGDSLQNQYR